MCKQYVHLMYTLGIFGFGFLMTSNGGGFMLARSMEFASSTNYFGAEEIAPALGITLTQSPNDSRHYLGAWFGIGPRLESDFNAHVQIGLLLTSQGVAPGLGLHLGF